MLPYIIRFLPVIIIIIAICVIIFTLIYRKTYKHEHKYKYNFAGPLARGRVRSSELACFLFHVVSCFLYLYLVSCFLFLVSVSVSCRARGGHRGPDPQKSIPGRPAWAGLPPLGPSRHRIF